MARRSIRKRRHHGVVQRFRNLAEMMNRADAEFVAQAAAYEQWFTNIGREVVVRCAKTDLEKGTVKCE